MPLSLPVSLLYLLSTWYRSHMIQIGLSETHMHDNVRKCTQHIKHAYVYAHVRVYVCVCMCKILHMHMYVYRCMYMHVSMHICMYSCAHTHTYREREIEREIYREREREREKEREREREREIVKSHLCACAGTCPRLQTCSSRCPCAAPYPMPVSPRSTQCKFATCSEAL